MLDPDGFLNITSYPDLRLNFFGIPKAGNTAIKASLLKVNIRDSSKLRHDEVYDHKERIYITKEYAIKLSNQNSFVNFSVIRSPYRRMMSLYHHFVIRDPSRMPELHPNLKDCNFEYFINFLFDNTTDDTCNHHMKSLCHFLLDKNNVIIPSIIFDLDDNILKLNKFITSYGCTLQKINANHNYDYCLSKKLKNLIKKRYQNDFITFKFMEN